MQLSRWGPVGDEKPGILAEGGVRLDVSAFGSDLNFFAAGGLQRLRSWLQSSASSTPRVPATVRLGPPIGRPSKIVCIGLNFRDHAAESKMDPPKEPVLFFKSTTALVGPNDPLKIPRKAEKVDWEVELAVVMEKGQLRFRGGSPRLRRWFRAPQRLLRTELPARTRWSMGQREERGYLRSAWSIPCNTR